MRRFVAVALLALACGPGLEGEPAAAPVADWSFAAQAESVAFAAADGTPIRFVLAQPLVVDESLYLRAMTILPVKDPALAAILEEGRVQVAVDGRVWQAQAVRLTTAAEIDPLLPELLRVSHVEAVDPHWDPNPTRYPGTQVQQWFFRVETP